MLGLIHHFIHHLSLLSLPIANAWRYHYVFPKSLATCRGIYDTWREAKTASQSKHPLRKTTDIVTFRAPKGVRIHALRERDYPILVHLQPLLRPGTKILNLGGSLAKEYCSYRELIRIPDGVEWRICEVPEIVAEGQKMLEQGDYPGLSFTSEIGGEADLFLSCGALQYLEPTLPELLQTLDRLPSDVFISRVPMQSRVDRYFTVQNIGSAAVPYRIENEDRFIGEMGELGYRYVDGWRDTRKLIVPYHRHGTVEGYLGFYFSRSGS
jgi:putative methyltransferase (TIGR04325 family)